MNMEDSERVARDLVDNLPRRMSIQWIGTIIWRLSQENKEFDKAIRFHFANMNDEYKSL